MSITDSCRPDQVGFFVIKNKKIITKESFPNQYSNDLGEIFIYSLTG